ncbi:PspC domain-containing protein [Streptacidiphilus sp. EB129]|uniref:PspC domain-containing protein n=1 Tax=Streptacidiphilus sp. EB129 TaxID=3156262 RepID=UPI003518EF8F
MTADAPPPPPRTTGTGTGGDRPTRATRPPLERSRDRRVVAGVCAGLGRHTDIDPVVFRVVIAVLCLSGGVGLFIYGLAWLVMPVAETGRNELQRLLSGRVDSQSLGAVLVTVLGTGIFFTYMGDSGHIFPLLLIALLAFAALRYDPDRHTARRTQYAAAAPPAPSAETPPPGVPAGGPGLPADATGGWLRRAAPPVDAPPAQASAPVPAPAPAWWQRPDPLLKPERPADPDDESDAGESDGGTESAAPADATPFGSTAFDGALFGGTPPPAPPVWSAPPQPPARRRRDRSVLGSVFFFLAMIAGGVVWAVAEKQHHGVNLLALVAVPLLVLGVGLMIGAFWGRTRSLVVWATLLTLAAAALGASPVRLSTRSQTVTWAPASVAALQPSYSLNAGQATLDLSRLALAPGQTVSTRVQLGVGQLRVILPLPPADRIRAHAGVGDVRLPAEHSSGGLGVDSTMLVNGAAAATSGTIDLDLNVGAGEVRVNR